MPNSATLANAATKAATTEERTDLLWNLADQAGHIELVRKGTLSQERRRWVREGAPTPFKAAYVTRLDVYADEVASMLDAKTPLSVVTAAVKAGKVNGEVLKLIVERGHAKTCYLAAAHTPPAVVRTHPQLWWAALEAGWSEEACKPHRAYDVLGSVGPEAVCDPSEVNLNFAADAAAWTLRGTFWDSPHALAWAKACTDTDRVAHTLVQVSDDAGRKVFHPGVAAWVENLEVSTKTVRIAAALESRQTWQAYLAEKRQAEEKPTPKWSSHEEVVSAIVQQRWRGARLLSEAANTITVWDPVEDVIAGRLPVRYAEQAAKARPGSWEKLAVFFGRTNMSDPDVRETLNAIAACPEKVRQHPQVVAVSTKAVAMGVWPSSENSVMYDIKPGNVTSVYARVLTNVKLPASVWEYVLDCATTWPNPQAGWEFFTTQLPTWDADVASLCDTTASVL